MRWDIRGQLRCFREIGDEVDPVGDSKSTRKKLLIEKGDRR
jgi:hypothetical protein